MRVILDGVEVVDEAALVSVYDWAVLRGFGVFEVVRSYGGRPFRLEQHLDRLQRSAAAIAIPLPPRADLEAWVTRCAADGGDCQVRVVITGGGRDPLAAAPSRAVVLWEPIPQVPSRLAVLPMKAPWHPATDVSGFSGVKWTSYAPNMASTDRARAAGFDEALLVSIDSIVLEGPTFTIAWMYEGRVETPGLELGILASITRDVMVESATRLGCVVHQGAFPLDRLLEAEAAFALSTVKEVVPIERVGDRAIPVGPFGTALAAEFGSIVASETGSGAAS